MAARPGSVVLNTELICTGCEELYPSCWCGDRLPNWVPAWQNEERHASRDPSYVRWDAEWYLRGDRGRGGGGVFHLWNALSEEEARVKHELMLLGTQEGAYLFIHAASEAKEKMHEQLFSFVAWGRSLAPSYVRQVIRIAQALVKQHGTPLEYEVEEVLTGREGVVA